MRKIAVVLALILCCVPFTIKGEWKDPFTCDPFSFTFDFPQKASYDTITFPFLVRSALGETQEVTVSMWPYYAVEERVADSAWFTIEPQTAILPANGIAAFNISCRPSDYEEIAYRTYVKVARTINGEQYWHRPLSVLVRFGIAVPVIDYTIEGFKVGEIRGDEGTGYTVDQIPISVHNRAYTPNEFMLYPVEPQAPSETPSTSTSASFTKFQNLWRQEDAVPILCEPIAATYNPVTKKYDQYALYMMRNGKRVEFGKFLAASYDRSRDKLMESVYPYYVKPRTASDVPFVLQVNRGVPSGVYRLQIHVAPTGLSLEGTGAGVNIQYQCKMALLVERHAVSAASRWWMPIAISGGLCLLGMVAMVVIEWRKRHD